MVKSVLTSTNALTTHVMSTDHVTIRMAPSVVPVTWVTSVMDSHAKTSTNVSKPTHVVKTRLVPIFQEASHALVLMVMRVMLCPVALIFVNAATLISWTVMLTLCALTSLAVTNAFVTLDTLVMVKHVKISTNVPSQKMYQPIQLAKILTVALSLLVTLDSKWLMTSVSISTNVTMPQHVPPTLLA